MAQNSPRSLKHEYELYVENEIENYKESVSRSAILKIGDEAAAGLRAGEQFAMDELLLWAEVDRIIRKRLRIPAYDTWRRKRMKMLEEYRRPEHWGLSPDDLVVRAVQTILATLAGEFQSSSTIEVRRGGRPWKSWLLRIVRNCAYDWIARRKRGTVVPLDVVLGPTGQVRGALETVTAEAPDAGLERDADRVKVNRLVAALPPEFREVLVLREVEELSYREIAAATGTPIGTVMSRLARGRALLKRGWERESRREMRNGV